MKLINKKEVQMQPVFQDNKIEAGLLNYLKDRMHLKKIYFTKKAARKPTIFSRGMNGVHLY